MGKREDRKPLYSYAELLDCLKSGFFFVGVALALLIWIVEPFIDAVILGEETFFQQLTQPTDMEIYFRSIVSILIIIFSYIGGFLLNRSRRAEEKLKESDTKFRDLVESSPQGIFVHRDFKLLFANQQCAVIFGYKNLKEMMSLDSVLEAFWSPEERERMRGYKTHRMDGGEAPAYYECRGLRRDGSPFWFESYVKTINWQGVKAIRVAIIDITEHKQVQERIQYSEERYGHALDATSDGVWDWNIKTGDVMYSDTWCQSLGYEPDEVSGKISFWENIVHPDDKKETMNKINAHLDRKTVIYICENRLRKKSGRYRHNLGRGRVVKWDTDGSPLRMIGTDTNITERKQVEEKLRYLSIHDSLTGLYNRNELEKRITEEVLRAARYNHILSIFMLDIDHFKRINDTHGHRAGDAVLRSLSALLERSIRKIDFVARYGGEEFVIVLPETPLPKAQELAQRLCSQVAELSVPIKDGKELKLTISIGIATFPEHAQSWIYLLETADLAMYAAKKAGRNQVMIP
jgi:diguanylate cyclase (GGDEF)-like protein/PAS domain S-box-containing protein